MHPNPPTASFLQEFMSRPDRRYLFGATPYALGIASSIPVRAVIDDSTEQKNLGGIPIIRTVDAPEDALVIATTLGRPRTATLCLSRARLRCCDYFTFHRYSGVELPFARFWTGFGEDARDHAEHLDWVRARIQEEESRDIFERIVRFRLTADSSFIGNFQENQHNQYFEDFLRLDKVGECFVDAGGFDGHTTEQFIARCPEYTAVHIFEPDPRNISIVRKVFARTPRVHCYPFGLGEEITRVRFDSSGSTSTVSSNGSVEIDITTLDGFLFDDVTFLKMDIEGGEIGAIRGARETILRSHPRLAVCVYHEASDLWRIPKEVLSIRNDYQIYLRHYTEGVTETVMFFIPT